MKYVLKISLIVLFNVCFLQSIANSQMNLEWMKRYHGSYSGGSNGANAIDVDDSGNVYVTGSSQISSSRFDYVTIKYNKFGDSIWTSKYGNDYNISYDLVVDDSGNVFVAGAGPIIKYNPNGNVVWVSENYQVNYKILLDSLGNIYVAGVRWYQYITSKYDKYGKRLWNKMYSYEGVCRLYDMVMDDWGNIIITGSSEADSTDYDYATIKYSNNGNLIWIRRYNGLTISGTPFDAAHAVETDRFGNIYVTGNSRGLSGGDECVTIKYDSSGNEIWIKSLTSASGAYDIKLDNMNSVYVAGRYGGSSYTFKLDFNSNFLWGQYYFGGSLLATNFPKMILDSASNVYVTANANTSGAEDYAFIKYDRAGNKLYDVVYSYSAIGADYVNDIALDKKGVVYLTGEVQSNGYAFATVKFSPIITSISNNLSTVNNFELSQNYPNPFNPVTRIEYSVKDAGPVKITLYDIIGRIIVVLVNENKLPGNYSIVFNAGDYNVSSGIYLYKFETNNFTETKRMILLK